MILAALAAVTALLGLGQLVVMLWFMRGLSSAERRAREDLKASIRTFVTPAKEGDASPLALLVDQCAVVLAGRLMQQLQQRASGISSGMARQELAETQAEISGASPWLGMLSAFLPKKFKNQLLRNPQMVGQLAMFGKNNGGQDTVPGPGGSVRDRLQKGG